MLQSYFTFQYGSIKSKALTKRADMDLVFTFQYGSIKSANTHLLSAWIYHFTFQYGSIKSSRRLTRGICQSALHSSMVLLNLLMLVRNQATDNAFTFQYGSIKSGASKAPLAVLTNFTFQYGSIKSRLPDCK